MNMATQFQILYEAVYISNCADTVGKGMNPTILPPTTGKIVGQTEIFSFGMATGLEGKLWIQTC